MNSEAQMGLVVLTFIVLLSFAFGVLVGLQVA